MNLRRSGVAGAFLAAALQSTSALAEGWYLGGSIGGSRIDVSADEIEDAFLIDDDFVASDTSIDEADFGWKGYLGYRLHELLAVELGYVDLGEATFDTTIVGAPAGSARTPPFPIEATATADGPQLCAIAHLPLPGSLTLLARAGAFRWNATFTEKIPDPGITRVDIDEEDVDLMYGAGLALAFNESLSARLEWERFEDVGRGIGGRGGRDVDFFSAGVVLSF
jgi:opacity protein-like surface antigen